MTIRWPIVGGMTALCLMALAGAAAAGAQPPRPASAPAAPAAPPPRDGQPDFPALEAVEREVARLIDSARPSVVGVIARSRLEPLLDALGDNVKIETDGAGGGPIARRIGSGLLLDTEGHVGTLASVVSGASEVLVLTGDGERLRARVRGVDDYSGIAVLDVERSGIWRGAIPARFADSDDLKTGALVVAFSSPFSSPGGAPAYSFGFVSGTGMSQGPARRCSYIQFNAYAAPGAAGGPILDSKGRVVGMLFGAGEAPRRPGETLIQWDEPTPQDDGEGDESRSGHVRDGDRHSGRPGRPDRPRAEDEGAAREEPDQSVWILRSLRRGGSSQAGVAYAVPANLVRRVSEQIIRSGSVKRGWLGMKIEENEPGEVHLLALVPGGPADKAGLLAGDRILAFDDQTLSSSAPLVDGISSSPPGTSVKLGLERDGRRMNVAVVLGEVPGPARPERAAASARTPVPPMPPTSPMAPPAPGVLGTPMPAPSTMTLRLRAPILGVELDVDTDDEVRSRLGAPEGVGLLVQKVHEPSRAQRAGLLSGDVLLEALGVPIRSLDDLRRVLRTQGPRDMEMKVVREGKQIVLLVPPPPQEAPAPPPQPGPRRQR